MSKAKLGSLSNLSWLLVFLLLVCNLLLIWQNLGLRAANTSLISDQKVKKGEKIEPFQAVDIDNNIVRLDNYENTSKRLILYSSITCPYCKRQNPVWHEFIRQIDDQGYEILQIFRDSEDKNKVSDYLKNAGLSVEEIASSSKVIFLNDEYLQKNKLNGTPLTLLVDERGEIEKVWIGLWNNSTIADVNKTFEISLQPLS